MRKCDRERIVFAASNMSDDALESWYYQAVLDSLGSETESMYELGYDVRDIREQERFERYNSELADLLASLCCSRGIVLWEDETNA